MPEDTRPNIIFINTDQQRGDCLGVEGHPVLQTPSMDGVAHRGVRFSRFYSACPSCIAARRSMMTGQDPQTHGMVGYRDRMEWEAPPTLPQVLRDNGYQTWLVGRGMHLHPRRKRYGFDEMETNSHIGADDYYRWLAKNGPPENGGWFGGGVMHNDWTAKPWPLDEHLHFTNWTVERALRFLRRRDPSCPFFLVVGFIAPHPPLQPPAFYMERYLRTGVPDPAIGDWAVKPDEETVRGDTVAPDSLELTGEALLSARAAYYGLINHVDDQLRRLLNPITGVNRMTDGNTIVVFTSDHGEMLGDHHMWRKSRAFEGSARVPFLMSAPQRFGLEMGSVVDRVATHADIMPTLLDMAGIDCPDSVDGRSLVPFMRGESSEWRDCLHIEHAPYHHALTDGLQKYIWRPRDGRELFFDLTDDPNECRNLLEAPGYESAVSTWRQRMIDRLRNRPEGFCDGEKLVAGKPYGSIIPGTNGVTQ